MELNAYLLAASFAGDYLLGGRVNQLHTGDRSSNQDLAGILSRDRMNGMIFRNSAVLNGIAGLPFDVADLVLNHQGIPSASEWSVIFSRDTTHLRTFHSLGGSGGVTLAGLGIVDGGTVYALPFGRVAPSGMALVLGTNDPANGFLAGKLLNWGATMVPVKSELLGMGHTFGSYP